MPELGFRALKLALSQQTADVQQLSVGVAWLAGQRFGGEPDRCSGSSLSELHLSKRDLGRRRPRIEAKHFLIRGDRRVRLSPAHFDTAQREERGGGLRMPLDGHVCAGQRLVYLL